jgi:hypothetical protein
MLIEPSSLAACRSILIGSLIFATLVIPLVQLSFGFQYVDKTSLCPIQKDLMLLMALGGVFELIFFALVFGFLYSVIPSKYKKQKAKTAAQKSAQGNNRASVILIGNLSRSFFICIHFFFLFFC